MTKVLRLYIIKYNLCIQNTKIDGSGRKGEDKMDKKMKAYAKINLGLDVIGRFENGYHEVKMVMQTIGIYDVLSFEKTEKGIVVTTDHEELNLGEDNLIYKAARLMMEHYGIQGGITIHLEKHIPIAAGMAGGSTDAAATMKGINELFELGIAEEELMDLGVQIGADVPYCIMGGTALAEGIGEKLSALPKAPNCSLLIVKPDVKVSTKYVYEHLDAEGCETHPDIDGMVQAIKQGDLDAVTCRMGNVLEQVTVKVHPEIEDIKKRMRALGAEESMMSGSGPTVFGIFKERAKAEEAYRAFLDAKLEKEIFLTEFA